MSAHQGQSGQFATNQPSVSQRAIASRLTDADWDTIIKEVMAIAGDRKHNRQAMMLKALLDFACKFREQEGVKPIFQPLAEKDE